MDNGSDPGPAQIVDFGISSLWYGILNVPWLCSDTINWALVSQKHFDLSHFLAL